MRYAKLGRTGWSVSRLGLGCMSCGDPASRDRILDEAAARPLFERALEAGIDFLDTADVYSDGVSEEIPGRALRDLVPDREDSVVATRCCGGTHRGRRNRHGLARKNVLASCDASRRRLGKARGAWRGSARRATSNTGSVRARSAPREPWYGPPTVLRSLGVSWIRGRFGASPANRTGAPRPAATADRGSRDREEERETIPFCLDDGVGLIPSSPLARGFLAGNRHREGGGTARAKSDDFARRRDYADNDFEIAEANAALAARRGVQPVRTAPAWLLARPGVTAPIVGATKLEHLDAAVAAVDRELSGEELAELAAAYRPHPVLGHR
mgnify:FL=1